MYHPSTPCASQVFLTLGASCTITLVPGGGLEAFYYNQIGHLVLPRLIREDLCVMAATGLVLLWLERSICTISALEMTDLCLADPQSNDL